ncbi:glycosyltransferase [Cellulomonas sp. JZ18]|uniref:glycosyltransferase family 2 protein n=1 Tax=Cellulomonas sp. JZ18 TaxID=2654191 RepID=UPI0012D400FB|nr:glycosyltransferase [Cellulomonas sp. JZ18]QGQ20151.1 glycosyltransferase [Cellulomonas sp. JZ18]
MTAVVAMLTYRRPEDLRVAVPAFLAATSRDGAGLLVVDNDPAGSARAWVEGLRDPRVRYVHEPRPGIAAGRNRALDECADADVLVFVDDDERPEPGWWEALTACHRATGATGVVGAVVSEFVAEPEPWVRAGRFFERRRLRTGTDVDVAATNNLLLDVAAVRRLGVRFDERFGLSGGSDTLFTRDLVRRGGRLVWCDEAVVVDRVPPDRTTPGWVLRRARRSGNSASRAELVLAADAAERARVRARYLARGGLRVAGGGVRVVLGALRRDPVLRLVGRRNAARGRGMVAGALGHVVVEYGRPPEQGDPAGAALPVGAGQDRAAPERTRR